MHESLRRGMAKAAAALSAAVLLSGCFGGGASHSGDKGGEGAAAAAGTLPKPTPTWDTHPSSLAALGDSITRGFDACGVLVECPEVSWATGTRASVHSVASRLLGAGKTAKSWNFAVSGARMADLDSQAERAATKDPEQITILMGANDACRDTLGEMTPVADYRSEFATAMATLHRRLPKTQVFVASIPDLKRLWDVGRHDVLGKQVWKLGICKSMLGEADSMSPAAQTRRDTVRDRVIAYNQALRDVCGQYDRCRYDDGAVFRYRFGTDELSHWDWFHPGVQGQAQLARIVYQARFAGR